VKLLETAGKTIKTAAAAVVKAVTPKTHRCDPEGFYCDCARKAEINKGEGERWLGLRRGGWLR